MSFYTDYIDMVSNLSDDDLIKYYIYLSNTKANNTWLEVVLAELNKRNMNVETIDVFR